MARASRRVAMLLVLALLPAGPALAQGYFRSPSFQGLASLFAPGTGQMLQTNFSEGAVYIGLHAGSIAAASHYFNKDDYLDEDERLDDDREIQFYNDSTLKFDIFALAATDIAFYSSYAAYRDGRMRSDAQFATPAPHETLKDLSLAPFRWDYLSRPTTFVPLLVSLAAISQTRSGDEDDGLYEIRYADDVNETELSLFYSVGIGYGPAVGEEAFFRGFLNNQFSHSFGRWWGLALSSGLFALGHVGQGNQASALTAGAFGGYVGWLQQHNNYAIGEGVAIHFWSNFLAGVTALSHGGSANNLVTFGYAF